MKFSLHGSQLLLAAALGLLGGCGGGGSSAPASPQPQAPPRTVSVVSIRPDFGMEDTRVTVTGKGLSGVSQVRFGAVPAKSVQRLDDTTLEAVVPAVAAEAPLAVILETPQGPVQAPVPFLAEPRTLPVLDPLPFVQVAPGDQVVLAGAHFAEPMEISFGGVRATAFTMASPRRITVTVPLLAADGPILLKNPAGLGPPSLPVSIRHPGGPGPGGPAPGGPGPGGPAPGGPGPGGPVPPGPAPGGPVPTGPAAPVLTAMDPTHGIPGTRVQVTGNHLLGINYASFGGSSAPFRPVSDMEIELTVPDTADSSFINVGTTRWPARVAMGTRFVVDTPPPPVIAAVAPARAEAGQTVQITGQNFHWISEIHFGRYTAWPGTFTLDSPSRITVRVPDQALPGSYPIQVVRNRRAGLIVAGPNPFRVEHPEPRVTRVCPPQSRVGFDVIIKGSGFTRAHLRVLFGHVEALAVARLSSQELRVRVPAGAAGGLIEVETRKGSAFSLEPFTVDPSVDPDADVWVDSWHINQGIQDYAGTVPLVAGRSGLLRVFVRANRANAFAPAVRVTLAGGGRGLWVQNIPAPRAQVPETCDEGNLAASWNLDLPGDELAPGRTLRLELDPGAGLRHSDRSDNARDQALGILALAVPRITLIPIQHGGHMGDVNRLGRTLQHWAQALYKLFPLADLPGGGLDLAVGPPFATALPVDVSPVTGTYPEHEWTRLMAALDAERTRRGEAGRQYVGVLHQTGPGKGLTEQITGSPSPYPQMVLLTDGGDCLEDFVHEVGHAFGLQHAPAGGAQIFFREYWPQTPKYDQANIGDYGYDLIAGPP